MKQGYQGYLDFQITDDYGNILEHEKVGKIIFLIGDLKKTYDGVSESVTYDEFNKKYNIWLTEEETLAFKEKIKIEAKILFEDTDEVIGTYIAEMYVHPTLITDIMSGGNDNV